jgi:heme o synthase
MAGAVYGAMAVLLGGLFILAAIRVWNDDTEQGARKMFAYSIFYLFALFTLLIVDRAPGLLPAVWH